MNSGAEPIGGSVAIVTGGSVAIVTGGSVSIVTGGSVSVVIGGSVDTVTGGSVSPTGGVVAGTNVESEGAGVKGGGLRPVVGPPCVIYSARYGRITMSCICVSQNKNINGRQTRVDTYSISTTLLRMRH